MSEDGQAFSWFTMANKTLGTYGAALVVVTKTIQEALTYFVQHLRHLIVTELPKYGYDVFGRRVPVSNGAFAGPAAAAGAIVGRTGRPTQRAQRTWACQPDLGAHLGARAGSLLGRRDGSAVASGCTDPSRCTGRPRCRADCQRLLLARTSTVKLDEALRRAAETVGGSAPRLVARFKNSVNRDFHNIAGRELREAGKFHHDPQTGAEVRAHSLARSERDYSAYGRRKRITGFVADLRQAFMDSLSLSDGLVLVKEQATGVLMSEDGQAFSWFTMANKTLGTYGAALVVVTKTVQEALTYFVQHLRHLIVTELPKYADCQRLLVAARTSTVVLDRALKAAADAVGGDRELRESGALTQSAETASEVRNHSVHTAARDYSAHGRRQRIISYSKEFRQVVMMSEDGQAFSWFTMANKTLGTYGAALVLVTKTIQEAVTYFVQHLRHLIVTELPKNGYDVFGRRAPNSNAAFAGPAAAAGAIVGRSGRPTQRAQRTWACQPDLGGHLGARAGSLLGRRDGSAVASGCTGPSRCTGRPRCRGFPALLG
ncbi:hypothetical protein FJT64_025988 [Amphibalanus amphitrite]|uniref:Uncharacterized protein n=1 Tax=Amphibalanus amphitrite TaxID=1232801 RepID=A0A6A4WDV6_AMPAM|nr:hypothetical protein FJT64_025988 [Amphibalanus amphitrite]